MISRVDAPCSGNVLLRTRAVPPVRIGRRRAARLACCSFIAGKIHNARNALLRSARESDDADDIAELNAADARLGEHVESASPG